MPEPRICKSGMNGCLSERPFNLEVDRPNERQGLGLAPGLGRTIVPSTTSFLFALKTMAFL